MFYGVNYLPSFSHSSRAIERRCSSSSLLCLVWWVHNAFPIIFIWYRCRQWHAIIIRNLQHEKQSWSNFLLKAINQFLDDKALPVTSPPSAIHHNREKFTGQVVADMGGKLTTKLTKGKVFKRVNNHYSFNVVV